MVWKIIMNHIFKPGFFDSLSKFPIHIQKKFWKQLGYLLSNIRHPSLRAKKYNEAKGIWQARVDKDVRFYFSIKGETYFFLLYFISIIASTIPSYEKHKTDYYYNAVGASGAVSAIVFSAILLNPRMSLGLMFIPIPIPAPIFGVLYLLYCRYAASHGKDNVAHDVHYWGSLFGALFTLVILPHTFSDLIDAVKNIF